MGSLGHGRALGLWSLGATEGPGRFLHLLLCFQFFRVDFSRRIRGKKAHITAVDPAAEPDFLPRSPWPSDRPSVQMRGRSLFLQGP